MSFILTYDLLVELLFILDMQGECVLLCTVVCLYNEDCRNRDYRRSIRQVLFPINICIFFEVIVSICTCELYVQ